MVAEGLVTERDFVASQWLHIRPRPTFAFVGVLLGLLYAILLILFPDARGFVYGALLVGSATYFPLSARRTFRQCKVLSEPTSIELAEGGLRFNRPNGEGFVPWSNIRKWRHSDRLLLLYPAKALFYLVPSQFYPAGVVFYLVPSHFFSSNEGYDQFVATIRERLGPAA